MRASPLDRRSLLRLGASGGVLAGIGGSLAGRFWPRGSAAEQGRLPPSHGRHQDDDGPHGASAPNHGANVTVGDVDVERMRYDPSRFVTTFDYGEATTMADGTVLREWQIVAIDKEIEIAPGVFFPAWTYNGQVPGPTLRCNEGDRLRVHFVNNGSHPHTIHFHGIHSSYMDGVSGIGRGAILPGEYFV